MVTPLIPSEGQSQRPTREFDWFQVQEQIDGMDANIHQAAKVGNVGRVRTLRAQRDALKRFQETEQARVVAPILAAQRQQADSRPRPGERTSLRRERGNLTRRVDGLEKTKKALLLKEGDAYISRAEEIEEEQRELGARIGEIDARLGQISEFEHEMHREKSRLAEQARREKQERRQARNEERLKALANECADSLAAQHRKRPFLEGAASVSHSIASRSGNFQVNLTVKVKREEK